MKYDRPVTPSELSPSLSALIADLQLAASPCYVDVQPMPEAPTDECFPLVERYVQTHGGTRVIGWALWEFPSLFIEAEFHSVWRSPDGLLVDITPKRTPTTRILFLSDASREYVGIQVDNIRRAISSDPSLKRYLATFEERFEIMNRGERLNQYGLITLTGAEAEQMTALESEGTSLFLRLRGAMAPIGPYSPCPCGSGRKTKWCHREVSNAA